jgi:hypothetical protein
MLNNGLAYRVTPFLTEDTTSYEIPADTERMYKVVTEKFRWGGLDKVKSAKDIYLDETVRRMVTTHRTALLTLATGLYNEGVDLAEGQRPDSAAARVKYTKALNVLKLIDRKLPTTVSPYSIQVGLEIGRLYTAVGNELGDKNAVDRGLGILQGEIMRYAPYHNYYQSLIMSGHYNQLTRVDRYVPTYLYNLLVTYASLGGDMDRLDEKLADIGFDYDAFANMLNK